jgi:hypothetical protein
VGKSNRSRKNTVIVTAVCGALLLGGGGGLAYGYWTLLGTGEGSAAVGTTTGSIVAKQTSTVTDLRPGGTPQTLSGNFDNTTGSPIRVANVVVSIGTVTKASGAPAGTCDATDYVLTGSTMAVNAQVPAGTAQGAWTGATIAFNNKSDANQDGCKNATVSLTYAVQ